uniref:C2H2-type domain-containing protein n=1 Tax=Oryza sativa subsp. japonica TaxID=39947 RepID=Q9LIV0_ORYSJ|nr:unnamed protein product [Oryza sativa]
MAVAEDGRGDGGSSGGRALRRLGMGAAAAAEATVDRRDNGGGQRRRPPALLPPPAAQPPPTPIAHVAAAVGRAAANSSHRHRRQLLWGLGIRGYPDPWVKLPSPGTREGTVVVPEPGTRILKPEPAKTCLLHYRFYCLVRVEGFSFSQCAAVANIWSLAEPLIQRIPLQLEDEVDDLDDYLGRGGGETCKEMDHDCKVISSVAKNCLLYATAVIVTYSRKDHLNRHLLTHQGKLFACPMEGCNHQMHDLLILCMRCMPAFTSCEKLRIKLDYSEVICCEPGCMKAFTNLECLKAHNKSCHRHVVCDVCGTKQLKKNFKRHQRMHEGSCVTERVRCHLKDCKLSFSKKSNLDKHVKAVHEQKRPFVCGFSGCGKSFSYKHVRDNHEKSSAHVYVQANFEEIDGERPRQAGGRKRKAIPVESLMRKRVAAPDDDAPACDDGTEYLRWLLSG